MARRKKIFSIISAILLLFIVGLYMAIFHFGLLEYTVNRQLKKLVENKMPLRVEIGDIGGDYISTLILKNISITYDDGINEYDMAFIPELIAEYSASDLWHREFKFRRVYIDSASLSLRQDYAGRWLIPKPYAEGEGGGGTIDFRVDELGLNSLQLNLQMASKTITFDDIILKAHLESREKTYAIDIDALSYHSSDERFNLNSGGGKATLSAKNLLFQDFFIITDSSHLQFDGQATLGAEPSVHLELNADRLNVPELAALLNTHLYGDVRVGGELDFQRGALSGDIFIAGDFMDRRFDSLATRFNYNNKRFTFDSLSGYIFGGCRVDASGFLDIGTRPETHALKGRLEHFNLDNLAFNSFRTDLTGNVDINGYGLKKETLILNVESAFDESWFDEYHAYAAAGNMTITVDSILFYDDFGIEYHDNIFYADGKIEYSGDIGITGRAHFDDLSVFNDMFFIKELGGQGDLTLNVTGRVDNPDLYGILLSDSLWIYDIFAAEADIQFAVDHFLYDRSGKVLSILRRGAAYGIPMDSAMAAMNIDSIAVDIGDFRFYNSFTTALAKANLDYMAYPQRLTIDDIAIGLFDLSLKNDTTLLISIDSSGYEFDKISLKRPVGHVSWSGRVNYDETLDITISGTKINIRPWVALLDTTYQIGGRLSGQVNIGGTFAEPLIDYRGRIDSLSYEGLVLGDLTAAVDYADERLDIDSLTIKSPQGYYVARGYFPINLSLTEVPERLPDKEQSIFITAKDLRFDFISLVFEEIENMTGEFAATLKMTGTPQKPLIEGRATVKNGEIKLYDLINPLEEFDLNLRMADRVITIEHAAAICKNGGKKGTINALGTIIINSINELDYNVAVTAKNFPAHYELGDVQAVIDADLSIDGVTPPTVSGDVNVIEVRYRENFAEETEGWIILSSLQSENSWDLNLNVTAGSNLWIKNDDIDAELAGELNFVREAGSYRYLGSMEVLRGKGYLAGRIFRIEPGGIISYEDIEYPNPRLDIYASTKIRGASTEGPGGGSTSETYDMRIHVSGTLDEPIITAAEDSPFSTDEIVTLLFTDYYQGDSRREFSFQDRVISGLSGLVSTQVAQIGSRTLGVETFEIDPVYGDRFDPLGTRLTVGFYTHPNLYVYGRSAISGVAGQEVGFEYRLRRFMLVEGRIDEKNLYHLILNFYWEY